MSKNVDYDWAVIGAGPAGMATVGKLLDYGVSPEKLLWIDPDFAVGDFGTVWRNVPSNTKVGLFLQFLHAVKSFHFIEMHHKFELARLNSDDTCTLKYMAEPLEWVTQRLAEQVITARARVDKIYFERGLWNLNTATKVLKAHQVVLAIGSEPKTLSYDTVEEIKLAVAMDSEKLAATCDKNTGVAVFGSSHSAMLAIRNLTEQGVSNIVNFYRTPLHYAIPLEGWILYDDTGLKGETASWVRAHIDTGKLPGLRRYFSNEENIARYLPDCQKAIYAVGFARRQSLIVEGFDLRYDPRNGIIAPGLFGVGIAFPESFTTPLGSVDHRVGLWKFMDYLNRVLPIWRRYYA